MDLSNLLPGFSFASDTPKTATVSKNLRNDCSKKVFLNYQQYSPTYLQVTFFCRLFVKSCRIFDAELFR